MLQNVVSLTCFDSEHLPVLLQKSQKFQLRVPVAWIVQFLAVLQSKYMILKS